MNTSEQHVQADIPINVQNNVQNNLQGNLQGSLQNSVQNDSQANVQNTSNNMQNNIQNNVQNNVQNNIQSIVPSNIQNNIQNNVQNSPQNINQNYNQNTNQSQQFNEQNNQQMNTPYNTEIQSETPEDNFHFSPFQIPESRVTGQALNLKYYQQRFSHTQEEEELTARWNNIVNTLKTSDGLHNIGTNNASSLRDKLLYLGSEIIPVQCICSRRMRPKISDMFCRQQELQRQQQHNSNDYQQYNEYSRRYAGPTTADWSNQASSQQSSGWGYTNGNIAPPGLMRGAM